MNQWIKSYGNGAQEEKTKKHSKNNSLVEEKRESRSRVGATSVTIPKEVHLSLADLRLNLSGVQFIRAECTKAEL